MVIVSDTTPLITLMKASQMDILQKLYGEVLVPEAVFTELTTNHAFQNESEKIQKCPFIRVVYIKEQHSVGILQRATGLDRGESEAIVYADINKADLLLIDEAAGRRVAASMGIKITGSIGVLLEAFDEGLITADEVDVTLKRLMESNRWISKDLLQYVRNYVRKS